MSAQEFAWWLDTPAGKFYAAEHGGRATALASYQAEGAAEQERLRDAIREREMTYPDGINGDRRRDVIEHLRHTPDVRPDAGTTIAVQTCEELARRLRREDPQFAIGISPAPRETQVKIAGTDDITLDADGNPHITWTDVT